MNPSSQSLLTPELQRNLNYENPYYVQEDLNYQTPFQIKLNLFQNRISDCLRWKKIIPTCKRCSNEHITNSKITRYVGEIKSETIDVFQNFCEIKYCGEPECFSKRFSTTINQMQSIPELYDYKTMWHMVIGFEKITIEEFKTNFSFHKKQMERAFNYWLRKLKNNHKIGLDGIKILDLSFTEKGMVYPHFHLAVKPVKQEWRRFVMIKMKQVEKELKESKRMKTPLKKFHVQIFKHAKKDAVFNYLTIRSIGLYKYQNMGRLDKEDFKPQALVQSIREEKYLKLNHVLTAEEYFKSFYRKRNYSVFGSVSDTCNIRVSSTYICSKHGELATTDILFEVIWYGKEKPVVDPPPDQQIKQYPDEKVIVVNMNSTNAKPISKDILNNEQNKSMEDIEKNV